MPLIKAATRTIHCQFAHNKKYIFIHLVILKNLFVGAVFCLLVSEIRQQRLIFQICMDFDLLVIGDKFQIYTFYKIFFYRVNWNRI